MADMPYQYLTFSDLYEEEVRSSAPSSPFMTASSSSLSPVFLLPTSASSHDSSSYHHRLRPSRTHSQARRRDVHGHAMLKTLTQDSDQVTAPTTSSSSSSSSSSTTSSSALHMEFLRVFRQKPSLKAWSRKNSGHASDSSAFSTPTSSRRSSFTSQGFASLHHPVSATSSANTSPAISRQTTKHVSDYEAMLHNTARQEEQDEANRQRELQAYFNQAADTGLSLRRF